MISSYKELDINVIFVTIGHDPNSEIFHDQLDIAHGYLKVQSGSQGDATVDRMEGVFAAGDVADHMYRQAFTSWVRNV